jgi:hypothetical protein
MGRNAHRDDATTSVAGGDTKADRISNVLRRMPLIPLAWSGDADRRVKPIWIARDDRFCDPARLEAGCVWRAPGATSASPQGPARIAFRARSARNRANMPLR